MKTDRAFRRIMMTLLAATAIGASQQNTGDHPDEVSRPFGNWSGTSRCTVKNTACHDETVVYHITELREKPDIVSVSADKIVDGKPINMGTLEFKYQPAEHILVCRYSQGVWRFKVSADTMNGTLTLSDGTQFRAVELHRKK